MKLFVFSARCALQYIWWCLLWRRVPASISHVSRILCSELFFEVCMIAFVKLSSSWHWTVCVVLAKRPVILSIRIECFLSSNPIVLAVVDSQETVVYRCILVSFGDLRSEAPEFFIASSHQLTIGLLETVAVVSLSWVLCVWCEVILRASIWIEILELALSLFNLGINSSDVFSDLLGLIFIRIGHTSAPTLVWSVADPTSEDRCNRVSVKLPLARVDSGTIIKHLVDVGRSFHWNLGGFLHVRMPGWQGLWVIS